MLVPVEHESLTAFYRAAGLEIEDNWVETCHPVKSLAKWEDGNLAAAATVSFRQGIYVLDYIAVLPSLRGSGHGAELFHAVTQGITPVYLVAKVPPFFQKMGCRNTRQNPFLYGECASCGQRGTACFPRLMKWKGKTV